MVWGEHSVGPASFHMVRGYHDDLPAKEGESRLDQTVNGSDGRPDPAQTRLPTALIPTFGTESPYSQSSTSVYRGATVFRCEEKP